MPPGQRQFPRYYRDQLESAMKQETRQFFAQILKQNLPVTDFLDADYSYINSSLARHYKIPEVTGGHFRKVNFPANHRRRGILGHASVLTATANGVETSPVVRGVWVLENILGTPPSPPPPDVPPIEPDTRGATTIRDQLAKHRNVAACADCHAKIDPWGFALEYYDPIGGFREHYPRVSERGLNYNQKGKPVDGHSKLTSGETMEHDGDLQSILLKRKDQFARTLVEKLLIHSIGRETNFRDNAEIDEIVKSVAANGYKFRDLVHGVLSSEIFRHQ